MPLRAKFDGQDKIATLINDIEWEEIKEIISSNKNLLILPCCEALAYLRISKLGTKHFVHRRPLKSEGWFLLQIFMKN